MTTKAIRRLMRRDLDEATAAAAARSERIALGVLQLLVERGVIDARGLAR